MTDNDAPVSIGEQVGRYLIEAEFSKPSWGWLFVARHATLRHRVLLKFISGDGIEFLQHEAQILARLKHPNILAIRDIDTHNQQAYIVLDYVRAARLSPIWCRPTAACCRRWRCTSWPRSARLSAMPTRRA